MNTPIPTVRIERHLAVDLHKHYLVVGGVSPQQEVVLQPRRMDLSAWPTWAKANLRATDVVVVEATTNAWDFYDETRPLVQRVIVANAAKIALIAQTRTKTDNRDVMKLARLSAAGLMPEVWVPPVEVRELRALLAHRRQVTGALHRMCQEPHDGAEPAAERTAPASPAAARWRPLRGQASRLVGHLAGVTHRALASATRSRHAGPFGAAGAGHRRGTQPTQHHRALGGASHLSDAVARHWPDHSHDPASGLEPKFCNK
jgi:hypothetical protein